MADENSEKPFLQRARSFRNWSNEVQYRRADFTDENMKGDFLAGTLAKGTYIVHIKLDGVTLVNDLTEGAFLADDTDIVAHVTGGTTEKPQRLVIAYVPMTTENLGMNI